MEVATKEKNSKRKPSPDTAKVAAKPSEVASWSRNGRTEKTNGQSAGVWKGISFMQNNISVFMVK